MAKSRDELIAELEALEDVQERIDRVAEDFGKGKSKYGVIRAWELGELLGLDFRGGPWTDYSYWAHRPELDDYGFDYPFAENVHLLKGKVLKKRFQHLAALSASIVQMKRKSDLPLSAKEKALLKDAFAREQAYSNGQDLMLAFATLTSSKGVKLDFEVCIGDGGDPFDAKSPYDLRKGKGFDERQYIEIF